MRIFFSISVLFYTALSVSGQVGELLWEDNFNNGQLDLKKWSYESGTGVNGDWGTGQLDRATNRPVNVSFLNNVPGAENGCLVITTQKEFYIDRNYTSGRINTAGKASWGPGHRIVARVFPRDVKQMGQGFAFWMMPDEIPAGWNYLMWPQGGEIDIMEYVGSIPFHNLGSVHYAWFWQNNQWTDWNHGHQGAYYSYQTKQVPNPAEPGYGNYPPQSGDANAGSTGFHNYGIDWYPDRIEFFVDDNVYHVHYLNDGGIFYKDGQDGFAVVSRNNRRTAVSEYSNHFTEWFPFEHKMYAILSAGVGGSNTTYGGAVVPEAQFPCSVYIDWVRVYKLDTGVGIQEVSGPEFRIYPNPASQSICIEPGSTKEFEVVITDITGQLVANFRFNHTSKIDVTAYPRGIYLVTARDSRRSYTKEIVIQ